jgi:hypothetical protein
MREWLRSLFLLSLVSTLALPLAAGAPRAKKWYRGNTHTHTLWSDGDAAPELVADWYKSHGYHFLVLSDHNVIAEGEKWKPVGTAKGEVKPESLEKLTARFGRQRVQLRPAGERTEMKLRTLDDVRAEFEEREKFIFIKGEEITDSFQKLPIHHNSMNQVNLIKPPGGDSVRDVLERTLRAVEEEAKKAGRPVLVHLNHPNFGWGVSPDDVAHVLGERFFEVYNGHRGVRNYGDKDHPSTEQLWDHVLTLRLGKLGGEPLLGLATDDAHHYLKENMTANPGRGWVWVRADALTPDAIVKAMLAGDFYASSGVVLEEIVAGASSLAVRIKAEGGVTYRTTFRGTRVKDGRPGEAGEVLAEVEGAAAAYAFKGDELYVRATVVSSRKHPNGYAPEDFETAWSQPVVGKRLAK